MPTKHQAHFTTATGYFLIIRQSVYFLSEEREHFKLEIIFNIGTILLQLAKNTKKFKRKYKDFR